MLRTLITALTLFVLWLLMSGVYNPFIIKLGIASSIIAVFVVRRMDNAADAARLQIHLKPFAIIGYWAWLMIEIAKANWVVTKIIMSPDMRLNRRLIKVPYTQKTDLGQAIFANSITLTPATISVEVEDGYFLVHALSYTDDHMDDLADMDKRVTATESVGS